MKILQEKTTPFWATVFTLIGFVILCGLGVWQLQRLEWKTTLIADLQRARIKDERLTFEKLDLYARQGRRFVYGHIKGRYLAEKTIALQPRTYEGRKGYHILTPFRMKNGGVIVVNRGWSETAVTKPPAAITVRGLGRRPEKQNIFVPENNPGGDEWYYPDIKAFKTHLNLEKTAPYILYATTSSQGVKPHSADWTPRNKHLYYTLFWFGMAGILVLIYSLRFLRKKN